MRHSRGKRIVERVNQRERIVRALKLGREGVGNSDWLRLSSVTANLIILSVYKGPGRYLVMEEAVSLNRHKLIWLGLRRNIISIDARGHGLCALYICDVALQP